MPRPASLQVARTPYVGAGADGARRSAQIDREELDTLSVDDPRRPALEASASYWDDRGRELEPLPPGVEGVSALVRRRYQDGS